MYARARGANPVGRTPTPTRVSRRVSLPSDWTLQTRLKAAREVHSSGGVALHGVTVAQAGRAVCLLGPSGVGKSTLAAAASRRGWALLSEGLSVVRGWEVPAVLKGPQVLRLRADSLTALGEVPLSCPPVEGVASKRQLRVEVRDSSSVVATAFVLVCPSTAIATHRLCGARRGTVLFENLYLWGVLDEAHAADAWLRCMRIAARVPVLVLERGEGMESLERVMDVLERALPQAPSPLRAELTE